MKTWNAHCAASRRRPGKAHQRYRAIRHYRPNRRLAPGLCAGIGASGYGLPYCDGTGRVPGRGVPSGEGLAVAGLRLEAVEFVDLTRWRWVLTDDSGTLVADHEVRLDASSWQFAAFADLVGYLSWQAAPDRQVRDEAGSPRVPPRRGSHVHHRDHEVESPEMGQLPET
jgi:hypothetical protein